MPNTLTTGVAGLLAHQRMLGVTGNNLANVNTTGYKAQRVHFADTFYQTLRSATAGEFSSVGGINPTQVGSGAVVSQIDRNFNQSSLELTGNNFDLAMEGNGFFVVNNGTQDLLTRAGTFGLDSDQLLVDQATGYPVQRFGTVGETDGLQPGYQIPGDSSIRVPIGTAVLGAPSETINIEGNLSALADVPTAAVLTSAAPLRAMGSPATLSTRLNDLDTSSSGYVAGDSVVISGTDFSGSPVSLSVSVDGTTTLGDIVAAINGAYPASTAAVDATGNLVLTADESGLTPLNISLTDAVGNTGSSGIGLHSPVLTTSGVNGGIVNAPVEVYDLQGRAHVVNFAFQRSEINNVWNVSASTNSANATLEVSNLGQIQFNSDGTFGQLGTGGGASLPISLRYDGEANAQLIQVNLGATAGFSGLKQTANSSSTLVSADGYEPGTLVSARVQSDGTILGLGSNGREIPIAQMVVASVVNNAGLRAVGQNHFETTPNSGQMQLGAAGSGVRGQIRAGQLESSNVDLAYEFTRLIVAQRGFSANARSITVSQEILDEVSNILR